MLNVKGTIEDMKIGDRYIFDMSQENYLRRLASTAKRKGGLWKVQLLRHEGAAVITRVE